MRRDRVVVFGSFLTVGPALEWLGIGLLRRLTGYNPRPWKSRVRERLIGALVLVAIVVPDRAGHPERPRHSAGGSSETAPTRRVEVPIGDSRARCPKIRSWCRSPHRPVRPMRAGARADAGCTGGGRRADSVPPPPPVAEPKPESPAAGSAPRNRRRRPHPPRRRRRGRSSSVRSRTRRKPNSWSRELRKRRYAAFVLEYRAGGQVLYRVRVGPSRIARAPWRSPPRLAKDGFQPVVARHP